MSHAFYLTLAYGVGGILLVLEIFTLTRRCRRASKLDKDED